MFNSPINSPTENIFIIVVKAENETAIDHDAEAMQSFYGCHIILRQILQFVTGTEVLW